MTKAPRHLGLVGLMGSGKTAVGSVVSEELGWPLVDVDDAIRERTGHTTRELWEEGGEEAYRPLERSVTLEALESTEPRVIGVPAGFVVERGGPSAIERGCLAVVWLRATPETLAARIATQHHRPLVDAHPQALLQRQASERSEIFERLAHLVLDVDGRGPHDLATPIVLLVRERASAAGSVAPAFGDDRG